MNTEIRPQLGMEGAYQHRTGAAQHRTVIQASQHLHSGTHAGDDRGPDEHGGERPPGKTVDLQVGFEGVPLAPERVAADGDVDGAEAPLVVSTSEYLGGTHDHAGAGPEYGEVAGQALLDGRAQAGGLQKERQGGGFPAGDHQAVDTGQISWGPDSDR